MGKPVCAVSEPKNRQFRLPDHLELSRSERYETLTEWELRRLVQDNSKIGISRKVAFTSITSEGNRNRKNGSCASTDGRPPRVVVCLRCLALQKHWEVYIQGRTAPHRPETFLRCQSNLSVGTNISRCARAEKTRSVHKNLGNLSFKVVADQVTRAVFLNMYTNDLHDLHRFRE